MAAEDGSLTEAIFTLNDFPTELIERFAPDLRPKTVSNLRLVSPRFRDVFTSDRYYRSYLCYGNRLEFYRQDLEEIGEARDRWWRCLEAEKRRLDNWRHGRPTRVKTVRVPRDLVSPDMLLGNGGIEWQGVVGEGNSYWIICELKNQKVLLANVTGHPIITVVDVSCHTSKDAHFVHLLADQVVIDGTNGSIQIFNIDDGNTLALKHFFTIEAGLSTGVYVSGMSIVTQAYRNLYINSNDTGILRVWDLKRALELDNLNLNELLPPNCVIGVGKTFRIILPGETEFPYVLVIIEAREKPILYVAVNVEERRVACYVSLEVNIFLNQWLIKGHELFMSYFNEETLETDVCIYNLRSRSYPCSELQPFFRRNLSSRNEGYSKNKISYEPPWLLEFNNNKVIIAHIDEPEYQSVINYGMGFEIVHFLAPFVVTGRVLLSENSYKLLTWDKKGELFDFAEMLQSKVGEVNDICLTNLESEFCPLFYSLSSFVVQSVLGDTLYICYF